MNIYGYHRTSTTDQHLDRGLRAINDFCSEHNYSLVEIFIDQATGKNFNRPDYLVLKRIAKAGDTIVISEIDRLGRNKVDTLKELTYFKDNNIRIMILEIPTTLMDIPVVADGSRNIQSEMLQMINNMLIEMYAIFAQQEIEKKEKRQVEGIQAKKARGEWGDYGRPKQMELKKFAVEYQRVLDGTIKPFELMRKLNLTRSTFYRYKKHVDQLNNQG